MSRYNAPFEIHVHGDVPLRADVTFAQLQDALKPLWKYAGARSLADGAESAYEEEPGIKFDAPEHLLRMCWTVAGDEDFRQSLDEMCMSLNELAEQGAAIEVTFYDTEFDEEEDGDPEEDSRDDFVMLFVGPNPAAILRRPPPLFRPAPDRCQRQSLRADPCIRRISPMPASRAMRVRAYRRRARACRPSSAEASWAQSPGRRITCHRIPDRQVGFLHSA